MGLIERAKKDVQKITSSLDGWATLLTITNLENRSIIIPGLHTKHHITIDPSTGRQIGTKNAHCSFSEQLVMDGDLLGPFVIRDARNNVAMRGFRVSAADSTGAVCEYVVNEYYPDETVGLIVCILGEYGNN